jgi:hypothetical protein
MTSRLNFRPVFFWPLHTTVQNWPGLNVTCVWRGGSLPAVVCIAMTPVRAPCTPSSRLDHRFATEPGPSEEELPASLVDGALDSERNFIPGWEKSQHRQAVPPWLQWRGIEDLLIPKDGRLKLQGPAFSCQVGSSTYSVRAIEARAPIARRRSNRSKSMSLLRRGERFQPPVGADAFEVSVRSQREGRIYLQLRIRGVQKFQLQRR